MGYYGNRNVSSSLGFAMGWLYWYSLGILVVSSQSGHINTVIEEGRS